MAYYHQFQLNNIHKTQRPPHHQPITRYHIITNFNWIIYRSHSVHHTTSNHSIVYNHQFQLYITYEKSQRLPRLIFEWVWTTPYTIHWDTSWRRRRLLHIEQHTYIHTLYHCQPSSSSRNSNESAWMGCFHDASRLFEGAGKLQPARNEFDYCSMIEIQSNISKAPQQYLCGNI